MSVLVAHSHDALIPRKRTSSFSFPLRPSKAPRLGLASHHTMGAVVQRNASTTSLRRTESFASLTELLLEAVSTPAVSALVSPSPVKASPVASTSTAPSSPPSKPVTLSVQAPPKGKDIPYTRTLQYQQDQRLARRRKAHVLSPCPASTSSLPLPLPLSRSDTLIDLSTPVAVAAHHLKEPIPTASLTPTTVISPAPQRSARSSKSKSKSKKGKTNGVPADQQRQPTPPSHYRLACSLASSSSSSSQPHSPSSPRSPSSKRGRPTPQVILPSASSPHAIPVLLTPRTSSPLAPAPPTCVPGRPVFPRSKKDVCGQLRKIACVRRMEGTERGKTMRTMGVRGAVEVWRATVELEEMIGLGKGDEMDVDVDAEGETDEECEVDPFEDVDIDGPSKSSVAKTGREQESKEGEERRGTLALSNSWVVVPGEDWEMVDCAVA